MLNKNYKIRQTAAECLKHDWFNIINTTQDLEKIDSKIINNINKMGNKNKIQNAVYAFIVGYLISDEDKEHLRKMFLAADVDNSG